MGHDFEEELGRKAEEVGVLPAEGIGDHWRDGFSVASQEVRTCRGCDVSYAFIACHSVTVE
jgi:hypothetical protein